MTMLHTFDPREIINAVFSGRQPSPHVLAGSTNSPLLSHFLLAIQHKTDVDPIMVAAQVARVSGLPCSTHDVTFFLGLLADFNLVEHDAFLPVESAYVH